MFKLYYPFNLQKGLFFMSAAIQPLCAHALTMSSHFLTRSRPNIPTRVIYIVSGLVYGIAAITIIPTYGVLYHSSLAIKNRRDSKKCWSHIKAATADALMACVGITLSYIAIKALLAMPAVLKEMKQFSGMELNIDNILAYDAVRKKFTLLCAQTLLPFMVPISYAVFES